MGKGVGYRKFARQKQQDSHTLHERMDQGAFSLGLESKLFSFKGESIKRTRYEISFQIFLFPRIFQIIQKQ